MEKNIVMAQNFLQESSIGEDPNYSKEFAEVSFVFAAVTGFCIGGISLANIVGIVYVKKTLTLFQCVSLTSVTY